jgi:hypothetical protein
MWCAVRNYPGTERNLASDQLSGLWKNTSQRNQSILPISTACFYGKEMSAVGTSSNRIIKESRELSNGETSGELKYIKISTFSGVKDPITDLCAKVIFRDI